MIIKLTTTEVEIDLNNSLDTIQRAVPNFFKTPHGKRESFTMHRGFLIVRNTAQFSNGPQRRTAVYLFTKNLEGSPDTFCISAGSDLKNIRDAKKLIDLVIATGKYSYGMKA